MTAALTRAGGAGACGAFRALWAAAFALCTAAAWGATIVPVDTGPAGAWVRPAAAVQTGELPAPLQALSSIVDVWDTELRLDGPRTERYERRVVTIQQAAALAEVGAVRVSYVPDYQRVRFHVLRIWRGGVATDLLPATEFRTAQVEDKLGELQITGRVVALAQVAGLRPGDRLETAWTLSGQNPVMGTTAAAQLGWNDVQYVHQRRVRVIYPDGTDLGWKALGPAGTVPAVTEAAGAGTREIMFSGRHLLPAFLDRQVPRGWDPFTSLQLSSWRDWGEVQRWAGGLFAAPQPAAPAVAQMAREFQRGPGGKREAAERAIRFVQDEVRYFSVSINENTHRPQPPHVTLERRFGDCKDKALLLVALLRAMDIEATPVLVSSIEGERVRRYIPTPLAFDHVIVRLKLPGGPTRHVDATRMGDGVPSELAADDLRLSVGLPTTAVAGQAGGLEALGKPEPLLSTEVAETVKVQSLEGGGEFDTRTTFHGRMAELLRRADRVRTAETRDRMLTDMFVQRQGQARAAQGFPSVKDSKDANRYELAERYAAEKVLTRDAQHNVWLARFSAQRLLASLITAAPERGRMLPLGLADPYAIHRYSLVVELPPNIAGREDPVTDKMETPHFRLSTQRSFRGNVFKFSSELQVLAAEVQPGDMKQFVESIEELRKKLLDVVVIGERNIEGENAPRLGYREKMLAQFGATQDATTRVIDGARLADADLAAVYAERGAARLALGNIAGASDDAAQALKRAPNQLPALELRASVNLRQRAWAAAEADVTRGMSLGADAGASYLRRGQIRYMAGRYADALQDFQQALKSSQNGLNVGFMQIWEALARLRLQQPPGPLPKGAAGWPRPLLEVVHGVARPEQALAAAKSPSADEEAGNLCEAYYYLAQWHFSRNETAQGNEYLRKTLETGVVHYMEYELAAIALRP